MFVEKTLPLDNCFLNNSGFSKLVLVQSPLCQIHEIHPILWLNIQLLFCIVYIALDKLLPLFSFKSFSYKKSSYVATFDLHVRAHHSYQAAEPEQAKNEPEEYSYSVHIEHSFCPMWPGCLNIRQYIAHSLIILNSPCHKQ